MTTQRRPWTGRWIPGLLCCTVLLAAAGCQTATENTEKPVAAEEEPEGATSTKVAAVAPETRSEAAVAPPVESAGETQAPATLAEEKGPGDGPPPREYVKSKVEAIESSLAPLNAVPAAAAE
ncbi:hypothetical protein PDESU_04447 [Pontiella desulfatans]|uniref:Uncharacterized protein n=1 Tax=Pontiella desulfatans TaxID=2750659 RepID=A0A6C2U770_PONDE|nr:hypothetical protein [Pontiella desulfatans]VGO15860.1 hypothetical protein PDESU_04447 [Pontiella desulfatans]